MPSKRDKEPKLTDAEIAERMERALRRSFDMPRAPHKTLKPKTGKSRTRARRK